MTQLFRRAADTWLRLALLMSVLATAGALLFLSVTVHSDYSTRLDIAPQQPVPFSHEHHVRGLGIDCRYCHTSVEVSTSAGYPPTETCMTCHSQLWTNADMLRPIRRSWAEGTPVRWTRVHDLPDFVYFDHSVHVSAGVGCVACHDRIDRMPLARQGNTMRMSFCLDCHRDPAPRLRPREAVFDMNWHPPADRRALGEQLVAEFGIDQNNLIHCYVCHR